MPWLATVNPDNDQPMRRVARWSDLPVESHTLLESFIAKRLLVRDQRDGEVVVEVALESLLRQWDSLSDWLRIEAGDLKDADNLERAALAWRQNSCSDEWLLPGSRLANAESLAAKPGFRERLNPAREFLLASRQSEDEHLVDELRRQEAELHAAQALATAETQAKEDAERHAAALRKRNWILRAALALAVVAAVVAGFLNVRASKAEESAEARARDSAANALVANSQAILSGSLGISDDVLGMQLALAAGSFPSNIDGDFVLLNALNEERNLLKIIKTNFLPYKVAVSPNGKRFVTTQGPFVQLWDAETGDTIGDFMEGHTAEVKSVAFSPNGKLIATGALDNTIRLWDAESRQPIGEPLLGHDKVVSALAFSPDGSHIASGSFDQTVRLWDAVRRAPIGEPMRGHAAEVSSVAFSPDSRLIASGGVDEAVRLWDAHSGQVAGVLPGAHQPLVASVAFSPDGGRIASAGGNTVRLWDVERRSPIGEPMRGHTGPINRVVYSRDGARLYTGSEDKTIRTWDPTTGAEIGEPLAGHESAITDLASNADGTSIVSTSSDETVRVWDPRAARVLSGHEDMVLGVEYRDDGKRMVSSSHDGTIRQWDVDVGTPVGPVIVAADGPAGATRFLDKLQNAVGAYFSRDGRQIVGLGPHAHRAWDPATGSPLGQRPAPPSGTVLISVSVESRKFATLAGAMSQSGGLYLAEGTDVQLHNEAMEPIGAPMHHDESVTYVGFSRDGRLLATAAEDFKVRVWDINSGRLIGKPLDHDGMIFDIEFTADNRTLAVAAVDSVQLWNVETGEPAGRYWQDSWVMAVAFSPDGSLIANGGQDGGVRLRDVQTGSQIGPPLVGHTQGVLDVDFSPDGTHVASASADKTIRVWSVPTASPEKLCEKMTYNMSRDSWDTWVGPDIPYQELCDDLPIAGEG